MIKCQPYGSNGILVNFNQEISLHTHENVTQLKIAVAKLASISYQIPAFCSLTIIYDPKLTSYEKLSKEIESIALKTNNELILSRKLHIPVCYEAVFAADLAELSEQLNLDESKIIQLHTAKAYHVYMMGFMPGFPYLGITDPPLKCNRKSVPRKSVPAGSVGLAGQQTGIYPVDAPGGWQLIGKTPLKIFNPTQTDPFLFRVNDQVQFYTIDQTEFQSIQEAIANGTYQVQINHE